MSEVKPSIALAAFSNNLPGPFQLQKIIDALEKQGISVYPALMCREILPAKLKALEFNEMVKSGKYDFIFDLSGGDLANLSLPWIDFEAYQNSSTIYAGFSDCSCIVNALCHHTGREALLFGLWNEEDVPEALRLMETLQNIDPDAVRVMGGNIRCFMKLAGTDSFPDLSGKLLFLESSSCKAVQFISFIAQLQQMNALHNCKGIILGRFNAVERAAESLQGAWELIENMLGYYFDLQIPLYFCKDTGHIHNSRGIWINASINQSSDWTSEKETD